jgi:hypothetical protein
LQEELEISDHTVAFACSSWTPSCTPLTPGTAGSTSPLKLQNRRTSPSRFPWWAPPSFSPAVRSWSEGLG